MLEMTSGPARKLLPAREFIDKNEIKSQLTAGIIVTDERRRRPLYFDGRFLTAQDLTQEQNYFLTRQADLGRAGGAGVVQGLMVKRVEGSFISIESGHGVTTGGELVIIPKTIPRLDLSNIAEMQRLNAAFGLIQIPNEPARTRSGIFILALRPVEFSANPIASYPTSINGPRTVEDGDLVEGVAITLIPFPDEGVRGDTSFRRARIAQKIFVEGGTRGAPAGVLPLAMIAIDNAVVRWVDVFMVRREVGAEHGNILGLGFAPRALREAHLLQYEYQLREVMRERAARGFRFAATEYFRALPPAGEVPAATIDQTAFTQIFFPPSIPVDLSIIPQDELPALIEESLLLPPIDLTLGEEELASTSVLMLIPVPREQFGIYQSKLNNLTRKLPPAAPNMVAKRPLISSLKMLKLPFAPEAVAADVSDSAWVAALSKAPMLWYVRRRNLSYQADVVGNNARVVRDEAAMESKLKKSLGESGQKGLFDRVHGQATSFAKADMVSLLSSDKFTKSKPMMKAALKELEEKAEGALDQATVQEMAARYADPQLGRGLELLKKVNPELKDDSKFMEQLISSGKLVEIDLEAGQLNEEQLLKLMDEVEAGSPATKRVQKGGAEAGSPLMAALSHAVRSGIPLKPGFSPPSRQTKTVGEAKPGDGHDGERKEDGNPSGKKRARKHKGK